MAEFSNPPPQFANVGLRATPQKPGEAAGPLSLYFPEDSSPADRQAVLDWLQQVYRELSGGDELVVTKTERIQGSMPAFPLPESKE